MRNSRRSPAPGRCWWGSSIALERALAKPARPLVAIVAGSKVSTKLTVLESLLEKVDKLIVGGGIANTFLAATGVNVGKSLCEAEMLDIARKLMARAHARGAEIPLPTDVVVARDFAATAHADVRAVDDVRDNEMILDIGPDTAERFSELLQSAGTIIWNGPVGVFEFDQFGEGTRAIANAIARSKAFSLAGGGDTLAAIEKYGVEDGISYISTGGGAFLEFVEGKTLPAVAMLEERAEQSQEQWIPGAAPRSSRRSGPRPRTAVCRRMVRCRASMSRASTSRTATGRSAAPHWSRCARPRAARPTRSACSPTWPDPRSASRALRPARAAGRRRAVRARYRARSESGHGDRGGRGLSGSAA